MEYKFVVIDNADKQGKCQYYYTREEAMARYNYLTDPRNKPQSIIQIGYNRIRVVVAEIIKEEVV